MLAGIHIKPLRRVLDDRGSVVELMRTDWSDLLDADSIVQTNLSITHPGVIRAWHRYARGQVDYFVVLRGLLKICVFDETTSELDEIVTDEQELQAVRIPGEYWHGFKALGHRPAWLLFFVNRLYDQHDPDRLRRPWNDPHIVPKSVNGNVRDPRVGKPWDWESPPHR
jgi:dTDP-4-dehydrorhamnose 3,5-epimerase